MWSVSGTPLAPVNLKWNHLQGVAERGWAGRAAALQAAQAAAAPSALNQTLGHPNWKCVVFSASVYGSCTISRRISAGEEAARTLMFPPSNVEEIAMGMAVVLNLQPRTPIVL
jgi:hypothetical protein